MFVVNSVSTMSHDSRSIDDFSPSLSISSRRPTDLNSDIILEESYTNDSLSPNTPNMDEAEGQRVIPEGSDLVISPTDSISDEHQFHDVSCSESVSSCLEKPASDIKNGSAHGAATFSQAPDRVGNEDKLSYFWSILCWAFVFAVFFLTAIFVCAAFFIDFSSVATSDGSQSRMTSNDL